MIKRVNEQMSKSSNEQMISLTPVPDGYSDWLTDLKNRIHNAQQRAAIAVNREIIGLYWQIGQDILTRQAEQGWGAKVIDRLAHDLRSAFPDMKGFSSRSLKYMRAFAQATPPSACCCAEAKIKSSPNMPWVTKANRWGLPNQATRITTH